MRTTLNIDDDLAAALGELARERARSLSRVANELMRAGLRAQREAMQPAAYDPPVADTGRPGVDVTDVATALEVLDTAG
jgi:predicted transcriptional regulator